MDNQEGRFQPGFSSVVGFLVAVGFFVLLFFMMRGIFTILAWAAPFLLIAAVLINYQTIINFGKWMYRLLRRNPIVGIVAVVLSVLGFPVLSGFLFGKSLLDRKMRLLLEEQNAQDEFVEYEELSNEPLELKQLERRESQERSDG